MRTALAGVTLAVFAAACGSDRPFETERSLRLALGAAGLPDGASGEYRIFVQDSIPVAHGEVANSETDTVRISSSARVIVRWQDATATVADAPYVFAPTERETVIEESDADTTAAVQGSYALASGGFALSTPGFPAGGVASWWAYGAGDGVLATGPISAGEVLRRGDLPPGSASVRLDTALVELNDLHYAYAPSQLEIPLNVTATLDLTAIDAPYALTTVALRMSPSGLPAGTIAPWGVDTHAGDWSFSTGGSAETGSTQTADLIPAGSGTVQWFEVTVDGVTYLPDPASQSVSLDPRIEPYEFSAVYTAAP